MSVHLPLLWTSHLPKVRKNCNPPVKGKNKLYANPPKLQNKCKINRLSYPTNETFVQRCCSVWNKKRTPFYASDLSVLILRPVYSLCDRLVLLIYEGDNLSQVHTVMSDRTGPTSIIDPTSTHGHIPKWWYWLTLMFSVIGCVTIRENLYQRWPTNAWSSWLHQDVDKWVVYETN